MKVSDNEETTSIDYVIDKFLSIGLLLIAGVLITSVIVGLVK